MPTQDDSVFPPRFVNVRAGSDYLRPNYLRLTWSAPLTGTPTGYLVRHRSLNSDNYTEVEIDDPRIRTYKLELPQPGFHELQVATVQGELMSEYVSVFGKLTTLAVPTMNFRGEFGELEVPEPNQASLNLPNSFDPVLTQGGFYVPVRAVDDLEAIWSFSWTNLAERYVKLLEGLQNHGTMTVTDPLSLVSYGYVADLDYEGVKGVVDIEQGEATYNLTLNFHVIRMELPPVIPELPDGFYVPGDGFGISSDGAPPLALVGGEDRTTQVKDGWLLVIGGQGGSHMGDVPPETDQWFREPRNLEHETSGLDAVFLEMAGNVVPPVRGTAYVGFKPLGVSGSAFVEDPDAEEYSDAPRRYFGYFEAVEGTVQGTVGELQVRTELTWFGIEPAQILPLGTYYDGDKRLYGAVVMSILDLPLVPVMTGERDELGFKTPERGVFVRRDLVDAEGRVRHRSYLPRARVWDAQEMYGALAQPGTPLGVLKSMIQDPWPAGYGAEVFEQLSMVTDWVNASPSNWYRERDESWVPGAAKAYERFLLGSGFLPVDDSLFFLYAYHHVVVCEFWSNGELLAAPMLDLTPLLTGGYVDESYVFAVGYDYERGRIALGVSRKGRNNGFVYKSWDLEELRGFGYRHNWFYIGGGPVEYDDGEEVSQTAWGWVRPLDGGFTCDVFLTPGVLASLTEYLP